MSRSFWEFGQELGAEERAAIESERTSLNLRRARLIVTPMLVVMVLSQAVFLWVVVPVAPAQRAWRDNAVLLTNLLIACFLLARATFRWRPALAARVAGSLAPCVALWGALSSANIQRTRPAVDLFLIANLGMVFVFRPRLWALVAVQGLGSAALIAGIVSLQGDRVVARTEVVVVAIVCLTVIVVGRSNLALLAREVTARRVIDRQRTQLEAQRGELAALNQSLEDQVHAQVALIVERSGELDRLHAELREHVDQSARDLTALLRGATDRPAGNGRAAGSVLNDRFEIESVLGAGGMSVVYRAIDRRTGERVALKVISARSAHELGAMRRFLREARASVRVEHPAIVAARHVDLASGQLFVVFPFVDGTSLDQLLRSEGPLPAGRAVRIGRLIADALAAAHAAGVVHRDIKPGNVMLTADERTVRVLDFGISKLEEADAGEGADTGEGAILGTPAYMAPEQVTDARHAGDRADVYSLGILLFEMLVGRPPFAAASPRALLIAQVLHSPPSIDGLAGQAPEALRALVRRCLVKAPAERPSARAVEVELAAIEATLAGTSVAGALQASSPGSAASEPTLREDEGSPRAGP